MNFLIAKVLHRPVSTIIFYVAIVLFAFISLLDMKQEFTPPIDLPSLLVISSYPAASPANTRELLTKPLENALSGVQGLKSSQSLSRNGLSLIELQFHWGTDMLMAGIQVREVIDAQYPSLPQQVSKPIVLKIDLNQKPVMIIGLYPVNNTGGKTGDLSQLRQLTDRSLRIALQQSPGVGTVIMKGGRKQEIKIEVTPLHLSALGLGIEQLGQLIQQANFEYPAGNFRQGQLEYLLKSSARAENLRELGQLPITVAENNSYIRLRDLSSAIYLGEAKQRSYFSDGREEGLALIVRRQSSANIIQLSKELRGKLAELEQKYSGAFRAEILYDASLEIRDSLYSLTWSLVLGIVMAFVVVILLIGNWRVAGILILSIPLSLLMTVLLMYLSGITLNSISLAALTLSVGLLVDNSVVVLEQLEKQRCSLLAKIVAVVQGSALPIFGATMTSVLIFLPLFFLPNVIGAIYRDLSLTLSYALLSSFLVSMTISPLLYYLFHLRAAVWYNGQQGSPLSVNLYSRLEKISKKLLKSVLRHHKVYLCLAAGLLLSTAPLLMLLPKKIVSDSPERELIVELEASPNTSIDRVKELTSSIYLQIEALRQPLEKFAGSEISQIYIESGAEPNDSYYYADPQNTAEKARLHLVFRDSVPGAQIAAAIAPSLRSREAQIQVYPPADPMMRLLGIEDKDIYLLSSSKDEPALRQKLAASLKSEAGFGFVAAVQHYKLFPQGEQQEVEAVPRREYLEQSNLSASQLQAVLQDLLEGKVVSEMELQGELYPIRLEIPGQEARSGYARIQSLYDLQNMLIPLRSSGADGQNAELRQLRLGQLADLQMYQRSAALQRVDQKDSVTLELEGGQDNWQQTRKVLLQSFEPDIQEQLTIRSLSDSVFTENAAMVLWILLISVLLLYFFLGMQFSSLTEPLLLLLNIPFSLWGSSILLWLSGQELTLNSLMGILILFGLCVNNAIVLREEIHKQKSANAFISPGQVYAVWLSRVRAISVTTLTTLLALLPSAFNSANLGQQNLALTIIGGMLSSSFFTLCILPLASLQRRRPAAVR